MKKKKRHIDIEIDKLTNSIEDRVTGKSFDTEVITITASDNKVLKKSDWIFDWKTEAKDATKEVYKLIIAEEPNVIQGLISLEDMGDHIFAHLIENAKHNKGSERLFVGGAANMVALACKKSFDAGYYGFVCFNAKTALKEHYKETLGAKILFGNRMAIESSDAFKLIERYYKNK